MNFLEIKPLYEKLGKNVIQAIETFLYEANIDYLNITYRIKEVESFLEKIERKDYSTPLEEIEDICGIRVICYYQSDVEKICEIIKKELLSKRNKIRKTF